jgi:uncharacterized glyoxalase superfamily protein PhnB
MAPPRARFGGIDIVPQDMDASVAFYRELGLDIPDDQIWSRDDGMHHVDLHFDGEYGLDIDSAKMTTAYDPAWAFSAIKGAACVITFRTDTREDVDALHEHMMSLGYESHLAPFDAFWGARFAVIVDPDGNHVSLMSPMDTSMGGPPPDF